MDDMRSVIATRVKSIRRARKMTQKALAEQVASVTREPRFDQTWVSRIEDGGRSRTRERRSLSVEDLVALAYALETPLPVLVTPESPTEQMNVGRLTLDSATWRRFLKGQTRKHPDTGQHVLSALLREYADAFETATAQGRRIICIEIIDAASSALRSEERLAQVMETRTGRSRKTPPSTTGADGDLTRWFEQQQEEAE